jgi:hypothetical protein
MIIIFPLKNGNLGGYIPAGTAWQRPNGINNAWVAEDFFSCTPLFSAKWPDVVQEAVFESCQKRAERLSE